MCGIAGIVVFHNAFEPELSRLQAMCDSMVHRGPDSEGMDIRDGIALGMRRLSIIDLEGGNQPIFNEDQSIRTVFNGEIYNFRELRSELETNGHRFRTNTDTEVIVHAYEEFGEDFPKHLNGMFAIAVHDSFQKKFFLVRDHIGIKPLYYSLLSTCLLFGSELKVLLSSGLVKEKTLDLDSLGEFLAWEYIPGQGTLLREIRKLEPGQIMSIDLHIPTPRLRTYWDVPDSREEFSLSPEEWVEDIDQKIKSCVQRQLISDVPLGAFLSGGVDSSLVVAAMGNAKTFSIGFEDPTYDELPWARKVARHLNTAHHNEVIQPDITDLFFKLMHYMDDPIGDFSIFPTYLVSLFARKYVKVVLSGDGGDELFGGYETYAAQNMAQRYALIPHTLRKGLVEPLISSLRPRPQKKGLVNKAKRFVEGFEHGEDLGHARWRQFLGEAMRRELFSMDVLGKLTKSSSEHIFELYRQAGPRQGMNRSLYVDFKSYLPDNCLVKVDRMSMAVSLEARVPFLDVELVETAFRMPAEYKVNGIQTKVLLKKIAARYVPREIVYRQKQGFSIPIKSWLKRELRPLMEDLLHARRIYDQGLFQASTVVRLKKEHLAGVANHSHILWSLMVFQYWVQSWLRSDLFPEN
jgi:asparagine synthase (glutamine-hydrolysing)